MAETIRWRCGCASWWTCESPAKACQNVQRLEDENARLRAGWAEAIALAQWLDADFGEEGADCFLAAPPVETAWHRARAGELLEERLAALAGAGDTGGRDGG